MTKDERRRLSSFVVRQICPLVLREGFGGKEVQRARVFIAP
jgi:hypothetical protein